MSNIVNELEGKVTQAQEDKWFEKFNRFARYQNNGVYQISNLMSTDTRELFLMYVAERENIDYEGKYELVEDDMA